MQTITQGNKIYYTNRRIMDRQIVNIRDTYKLYKIRANAYNLDRIPIKTYIHIVNGYIQFLMSRVFSGKDVRLPVDLGIIGIRGSKVKPRLDEEGNIRGLAPNWHDTKALWESNPEAKAKKTIVYCFNEHSNGMRFRFIWLKRTSVAKNKTLYSLKMSRKNKRTLNKMAYEGAEFLETKPRFYGNDNKRDQQS